MLTIDVFMVVYLFGLAIWGLVITWCFFNREKLPIRIVEHKEPRCIPMYFVEQRYVFFPLLWVKAKSNLRGSHGLPDAYSSFKDALRSTRFFKQKEELPSSKVVYPNKDKT